VRSLRAPFIASVPARSTHACSSPRARGYEIKELMGATSGEGSLAEAAKWLDDAIRRARHSRLAAIKKLGRDAAPGPRLG